MKEHSFKFYVFFLISFIVIFSFITYLLLNKDNVNEHIEVIRDASTFFAKTAVYAIIPAKENLATVDEKTQSIESDIFYQINEIRKQNHLSPLVIDQKLGVLARQHALDMAKHSYLNHTNLNGLGPNERALVLGINVTLQIKDVVYKGLGENIGFMPKGINNVGVIITNQDIASAVVYNWMLSEPHKKNILGDYFYTGIGVAYDSAENYYLVQEFQ